MQAVGDVDNRYALVAQGTDDLKKLFRILLGNGRGGLVHQDDLRVGRNGLGDFDYLLLRDGQASDDRRGADVKPKAVQRFRGQLVIGGLTLHDPGIAILLVDDDIFRDGHIQTERKLLIDRVNARVHGVARVAEIDLCPIDNDLAALIGWLVAADDLDQRGLSCAVFAQQRMNLTLADVQVDVSKDVDAGKCFADISKLQNIIGQTVHLHFLPLFRHLLKRQSCRRAIVRGTPLERRPVGSFYSCSMPWIA